MELHLNLIGFSLVGLAFVHIGFPARFEWKKELQDVSLINRQMMYIHTLFIGLMLLLVGILCLTSASDLVQTPLGKRVCAGLSIFWGIRLYVQFFGYSSKLWRGKTFETVMHIVFSVYWSYLTAVFLWVYFA